MIQKSKGILIVLSGFSGSGKGTIMKELMKKYSDQYALSISATTRSPRPGETDGVEYFFRTKEQFEKMIADDELIEYAKYVDNYYGTPKAYVEEQLAAGKDVRFQNMKRALHSRLLTRSKIWRKFSALRLTTLSVCQISKIHTATHKLHRTKPI